MSWQDNIHDAAVDIYAVDLDVAGSTTLTEPTKRVLIPQGVREVALVPKVTFSGADAGNFVVWRFRYVFRGPTDPGGGGPPRLLTTTSFRELKVEHSAAGALVALPEWIFVRNVAFIEFYEVENESATAVTATNVRVLL